MHDPHRQRRAALDRANDVRHAIARIRRRVSEDPTWRVPVACLSGTLKGPDAWAVGKLRLDTMLRSVPGIGPVKARELTHRVIAPTSVKPRLEHLTDRQRQVIAFRLLARYSTQSPARLERLAAQNVEYNRRYAIRHGLSEEDLAA